MENTMTDFSGYLSRHQNALDEIRKDSEIVSLIQMISKQCVKTIRSNNKILLAGNGGSAADSQHIAGELVSKFAFDRPALPAIALTTDTSILTAIGNDYGYEQLFSRQIEALGCEGDVFIAYSTSGKSKNIIGALQAAQSRKIVTVGFTGNRKGEMDALCDYIIKVPSSETPIIQEIHAIIGHFICLAVEEEAFK